MSDAVTRSGCPRQAAGPLTVALVAVLTTVGLGCTSAVTPTSAEPPATVAGAEMSGQAAHVAIGLTPTGSSAAGSMSTAGSSSTAQLEVLHRGTRRADSPGGRPQPVVAIDPAQEPPVVSADLSPTRSTRSQEPVRLQVDAVGIDVPVAATGVARDGSMALPDTVRRAGWYRYSALPGAVTGTTVVAAHVDTAREGLGPFAALADARHGDRVVVVDRAGDRHGYRITSRRHVPRNRLPVADLFDTAGAPRLVLITCGGAYDSRNGYHDNVVVLAEPDR